MTSALKNTTVSDNLLSPSPDHESFPRNFSAITYKSTSSSEEAFCSKPTLKAKLNIDLHIFELDNNENKYKLHTIHQHKNESYVTQLVDLLQTDLRRHTRTIEQYEELDEKTASVPVIFKPIIYELHELERYVFVYETKQYLTKKSYFQQSDRFIILVIEQFLPITVTELAKKIIKMQYKDRFWLNHSIYQLDYSLATLDNREQLKGNMVKALEQTNPCYYQQPSLHLQKNIQVSQYLKSLSHYEMLTKVCTLKYLNLQLLTIVLYYALKDYKIVVVAIKQTRHIMSEIIVALRQVLMPIKYTYPVVMAALSETHVDYVDTPVPSMVFTWASQQQCKQLINQKKKNIEKGGRFDIPTIMVDLVDRIVYSPTPSAKQSAQLMFLNTHIITVDEQEDPKNPYSIVDRAHNLLHKKQLTKQLPQLQTLVSEFKQSFLYRNHEIS